MRVPANPPVDPALLDLCQLATLLGLAANERFLDDLHRAGFRGLRAAHGFVFQHLLGEPRSISDLARRMGVSQQAASKVVAELRRRGMVETTSGPDARARYLRLSRRGRAAVDETRRLRAVLDQRLRDALGERRVRAAHRTLWDALGVLDGQAAVVRRAVRAP